MRRLIRQTIKLSLVFVLLICTILKNTLLKVELLKSNKHSAFFQIMCLSRLLKNVVEAVDVRVLESLLDILVDLIVEIAIVVEQFFDFFIYLVKVLCS